MTQSYQFICVENKFFQFLDVLGDGNCFFNCLVKSPHINVSSPEELRGILVQLIETEMTKPHNQMEELYKACSPDDDIRKWLQKLRKIGTWAGDIAANFICYFFRVNICIVTNAKKFWVIDIRACLQYKGFTFIEQESPSIFLYHHLFRHPFVKSPMCNHFGYLKQVQKQCIMDDASIYFGTEPNEDSSDKETICTEKERKNSEKQQQSTKKKRKNSEKQQKITIAKYWNIKTNDIKQNVLNDLVSEFQAESKKSQEIKTSIIDTGKVEAKGTQICTVNNNGDILRKRSRELSWTQRASIIYFYLHPFMGRQDMKWKHSFPSTFALCSTYTHHVCTTNLVFQLI